MTILHLEIQIEMAIRKRLKKTDCINQCLIMIIHHHRISDKNICINQDETNDMNKSMCDDVNVIFHITNRPREKKFQIQSSHSLQTGRSDLFILKKEKQYSQTAGVAVLTNHKVKTCKCIVSNKCRHFATEQICSQNMNSLPRR